MVPKKWIDEIFDKVGRSGSYDEVSAFVDNFMAEGFSITQVISQIHEAVVLKENLSDLQKSSICEKLAVSEARLIDGSCEYLQLLDIISEIMHQLSK